MWLLRDLENVLIRRTSQFATIAECCDDPLFLVRVNVYLSLAKGLVPFLTKFQADEPLLPFLCTDLAGLFGSLMDRILKPAVSSSLSSSARKLLKLDFWTA
eukprot:scpid86641/ scgid25497/ 